MKAHIIEDYLLALRGALQQLDVRERDKVVREIRDHLKAETARLQAVDSGLSYDEAALKATAAFGDPKDIGLAYGPKPGLVRKSNGQLLLHLAVLAGRSARATGQVTGRAVRQTLKWTGVVALILFVAILAVVLTVIITYKDTVNMGLEKATSYTDRTLVERSQSMQVETTTFQDSFEITSRTVDSSFFLRITGSTGCGFFTIVGPSGNTLYDTTGSCKDHQVETSFLEPGTYSITYRFAAFSGSLQVHGRAVEELPERSK